jgi:integrase
MAAPHWKQSDGTFTVAVYDRGGGRAGFLIRARFAANPGTSESHGHKEDAIKAAERVWAEYASGKLDQPAASPDTWKEAVERFVKKDGLRPRTRDTYERALGLFTAHVGPTRRAGSLTRRDVESWLHSMTCSPTSKQTYLRTLRAAVRWVVALGWLKADVTAGVTIGDVPAHRVRPWLDCSEWDAFLGVLDAEQRIRFGFVLETGLRREEVLQARYSWIHNVVGRPAIRVAPDPKSGFVPKWGQSRAIPLSAKAQEYLEAAKLKWKGDELIFQLDERPLRDPPWARDIGRACKRANVTRTDLHGLRRSCGARWIHDGMQLHLVSRLLGHQDISTTMRWYGGIADGTLATAIAAIDMRADDRANVLSIKRKAAEKATASGPAGDT